MNNRHGNETASSNPDLVSAMAATLQSHGGRITFAQFMDIALTHPHWGYYSKSPPIGREGDFITNVSVGPLFGRILARQFLNFRAELGHPPDFKVIEFGGHQGQLRADVLREAPDLDYQVVDIGDNSPDQITGCVFTNEFLDALPVHRVKVVPGEWQELYVTARPHAGEPFMNVTGPLSTPRLADHVRHLPLPLMEGYTTEINLRALEWLEDIARRLKRGYVFTIDYGFDRDEYFAPHRRNGTLRCYHRHTQEANPFVRVGEQDMTAHVEFSSFKECGERAGLETVLFCDQTRYLLEAGRDLIQDLATREAGRWSSERNQLHQLMHPAMMGRAFKVLIQRKGIAHV